MGICHLFKQPKPIILPVKHWIALHKHYSVIHGGKKNAKKTTKPFGECRKEGSQRTAEVADIRYQPLCTFTLFFSRKNRRARPHQNKSNCCAVNLLFFWALIVKSPYRYRTMQHMQHMSMQRAHTCMVTHTLSFHIFSAQSNIPHQWVVGHTPPHQPPPPPSCPPPCCHMTAVMRVQWNTKLLC